MFSLRRPRLLADSVPWRYPISDHAMLLDGGHVLAVFALDGLACETLHDDQIAHAHVQRNDLIRNIAFDGLTLTAYECRATADPADYLHKGTGFRSGYAEALDLAYREQLYDGLLYSNRPRADRRLCRQPRERDRLHRRGRQRSGDRPRGRWHAVQRRRHRLHAHGRRHRFTLTAGGTAFAAGDSFKITVAPGDGGYLPYTGVAPAAALLFNRVLVPAGGSRKVTVVTRLAEVNGAEIQWDPAVTGSGSVRTTALAVEDRTGVLRVVPTSPRPAPPRPASA